MLTIVPVCKRRFAGKKAHFVYKNRHAVHRSLICPDAFVGHMSRLDDRLEFTIVGDGSEKYINDPKNSWVRDPREIWLLSFSASSYESKGYIDILEIQCEMSLDIGYPFEKVTLEVL